MDAPSHVGDKVYSQELERYDALQLRVLGLINNTHPSFTELLGDAVVGDGLADHGRPDCTATGYLVITIDVMNYDIFSARAVASARFLGPSGVASTLRCRIVHANRISRQVSADDGVRQRFHGFIRSGLRRR